MCLVSCSTALSGTGAHDSRSSHSESIQSTCLEQLDLLKHLVREIFVSLGTNLNEDLLHSVHTIWVLFQVLSAFESPLVVVERLVTLLEGTNDI